MNPSLPRRTTLFVGALALDGLSPALASGADLVCIDLEDAVPPDRKDEARQAALAALAGLPAHPGAQVVARINAMGTSEGTADLRALGTVGGLGAIMLPKVEGADEVRVAGEILDRTGRPTELLAIVESAPGLEACPAIAAAHPRLKAFFFGGFDLSAALGCEMAWEPLLYARSRVVHAAAMGRIEALDSPYPDVADLDGLREACARVKALGYTGKAAKHASQVATIREAFTPKRSEIERARRIVERFRADPTRPLVYEGKLVELPSIKRLERIAALELPQA